MHVRLSHLNCALYVLEGNMPKYLVSNIAGRRHAQIYGVGAFFDLESSQHGWGNIAKFKLVIMFM